MNQKLCFLVIGFCLSACGGGSGGSAPPGQDPSELQTGDTRHWDLERASADSVSAKEAAVDDLIDYLFTDAATQSVLVSKDGYVIGERYADGTDGNTYGTSWSVAKSFYSAAVGIAIDEGAIESVDQQASDFLTEWQGTDKEDITIKQILQMRSDYPVGDEVFFATDQSEFAISHALAESRDNSFRYSNANTQLIEPILRRATGVTADEYLGQKLLTPLGVETAEVGFWRDATGENPMTYCCLDMKPEVFLRFGLLFAREGVWDGLQIISEDYVNDALTPEGYYGYQWWMFNEAFFGTEQPADIKAAQGLHGQKIYVWPDQDIVVVVMTLYEHLFNQGFVLDLQGETPNNFPNTCVARNLCSWSEGDVVPQVGQTGIPTLIAALVTAE